MLKNISIEVKPREKIGIVGRTGSGKSSLLLTLLRIVDYEGEIKIDNINIKQINLNFLRTKIAVIPQEPTLFSGTIRSNLDPFCTYNDSDIWEALEVIMKLKNKEIKLQRVNNGDRRFRYKSTGKGI